MTTEFLRAWVESPVRNAHVRFSHHHAPLPTPRARVPVVPYWRPVSPSPRLHTQDHLPLPADVRGLIVPRGRIVGSPLPADAVRGRHPEQKFRRRSVRTRPHSRQVRGWLAERVSVMSSSCSRSSAWVTGFRPSRRLRSVNGVGNWLPGFASRRAMRSAIGATCRAHTFAVPISCVVKRGITRTVTSRVSTKSRAASWTFCSQQSTSGRMASITSKASESRDG